ncbi:hypothetical protein DAPPUDRAFT_334089 [Daphnia pulex]|uniref:Uncharacterized protein n=1 Tax=Daphnia pulex TaxID=6669 RepID=E9HUM9_DAPPU|nr:hypothetical protein DAPPUDRAFT_334089 [Daphnia pulex]|eukprot:EFX64538.1 hypothetical protein DAPPUDRAFT_334089 [Daphnia pulex]
MPKKVKSDKEWRERLNEYAHNKFRFGQGQKPPPQSKWAKLIKQIELCPLKSGRTRDAVGRSLSCTCNFHLKEIEVKSCSNLPQFEKEKANFTSPTFSSTSANHSDRSSSNLPQCEKEKA